MIAIDPDLLPILELAKLAPSGDNKQPWRFKVTSKHSLLLQNKPEVDQSIYNIHQNASYFSHGALLENISIASAHYGWDCQITLFPDPTNANNVALIAFNKTQAQSQELFSAITTRCTNRKAYLPQGIPLPILEQFTQLDSAQFKLSIITEIQALSNLAEAASKNEKLVLQNPSLHRFLFENIRWTDAEDAGPNPGMNIGTLELKPVENIVFKLASSWKRMQWFNRLGLANKVAGENSKRYRQSAAVGVLWTTQPYHKEAWVEAGRVVEHIWLLAEHNHISFQPFAGILLLRHSLLHGAMPLLTIEQQTSIQTTYERIAEISGVPKNSQLYFMFRFGYSSPPTAHTTRLPLKDLII